MRAAVIQMTSLPDRDANLTQADQLLRAARDQGARLAVLPELWSFMPAPKMHPTPEPLRGPLTAWLGERARELGLWIVGGTFARSAPGRRRSFNTCPVLDDQGRLVAWYDKIHLFDLGGPGMPSWHESSYTIPGRRAKVVETPLGRMGLSVCYDLRFPELYRRLRLQGATIFAAPSAFTRPTGQAHWEVLVRARAVENLCFVLAAAQEGEHAKGRASYGRAMIVGPWGDILAECPPGPGVAVADLAAKDLDQARRRLDSVSHARLMPAAWQGGEGR